MSERFTRVARRVAQWAGSAPVFLAAIALIVVWAVTGPLFGYSPTWQLLVNTGTTIITFLMVFLIQSSQNHDAAAMQIKLDELLRAVHGAHDSLIALEDATEEEMGRHAAALRRLSRASGAASATRGPNPAEGTGGEDAHDVEAAARPDDDPASAERRDDAGEQPSPAS